MTRIVYKYPLKSGRSTLELLRGAQILTAQMQKDMPVLWALCDPARPKQQRTFLVAATGEELETYARERAKYISTLQIKSGLVFHVFEIV